MAYENKYDFLSRPKRSQRKRPRKSEGRRCNECGAHMDRVYSPIKGEQFEIWECDMGHQVYKGVA